jgi:ATP-dependent Clp protease ATP-binding subunit ClpC
MTLLFYDKEDFYDFKEAKILEGFSILSVTKLIHNLSLVKEVDINSEIIDLSALTEYNNIQSILEQVIYQFEETPIFICDLSKKEKIEYELRFVFDTFENIDKSSFPKKEKGQKQPNGIQEVAIKKHKKITDLSEDELKLFLNDFNVKLYGHSKFKDDFAEQVRTFRVFNKLGEHKILSLFLMGESGVGKTEVARTIFNCLKGEKNLAKINFGNYSNEFSLSSLIGSARGYIGSDDGEIFMKVRETDIGVLLIDEFEKSNSTLFNYFLEVLESGKMTSSLGEEMDLNGFIIVFTSNISKEDFKKRISPELRSRFDYKCMFTLLSNEEKEKYIEFRAENIRRKVNTEFNVELGNELRTYLISEIDISSYQNMRDINKQLKRVFLRYLTSYKSDTVEVTTELQNSKFGMKRVFLNIFN